MSKIHDALDLVEDLLIGVEHIKNTIEVLGEGYNNDHNDRKDCEISSLYILGQYIELVQEEQLIKLCDILEAMK